MKPVSVWWDREIDEKSGIRLRQDVRDAAHRIWPQVCSKAQRILQDDSDAAPILENAIRTISRYLDKLQAPFNANTPDALLMLTCHRSLQHLARKRGRLQLIGSSSQLSELLRAPDWQREAEIDLFLQELARELDDRTRGILRLRIQGYDWKEIGRMLHVSSDAARQEFWRGVRKAHLQLLRSVKINPMKR